MINFISKLFKTNKVIQNNTEQCSICMEKIQSINTCTLECCHKFHLSCIFQLYKTNFEFNNKCPLCRNEFTKKVQRVERVRQRRDGIIYINSDENEPFNLRAISTALRHLLTMNDNETEQTDDEEEELQDPISIEDINEFNEHFVREEEVEVEEVEEIE